MSKAVLVMDMPESCEKCRLCANAKEEQEPIKRCQYFGVGRAVTSENRKPLWCPLKPLPEKMQVCGKYPQEDKIVPSYKIGYNACIDELLKGATDEQKRDNGISQ